MYLIIIKSILSFDVINLGKLLKSRIISNNLVDTILSILFMIYIIRNWLGSEVIL